MARISLLARASLLAALLAGATHGARAEDDDVKAVPIPAAGQAYVVLAWNDLGMHCLNPRYDRDVILPPYNNLWAQVIARGNPPRLVTSGVRVAYRLVGNTDSYGKGSYGQFWDFSYPLLGVLLAHNTGVNLVDPGVHNGLSGFMLVKGDHFQVDGIPVVPVSDSGSWNPYQVAEITVTSTSGQTLAQTRATVPTSDEIRCDKCHGAGVRPYLELHDRDHGTHLSTARDPFLCASCHASPALRAPLQPGVSYLSQAVHGLHSRVQPAAGCYDCHPGQKTSVQPQPGPHRFRGRLHEVPRRPQAGGFIDRRRAGAVGQRAEVRQLPHRRRRGRHRRHPLPRGEGPRRGELRRLPRQPPRDGAQPPGLGQRPVGAVPDLGPVDRQLRGVPQELARRGLPGVRGEARPGELRESERLQCLPHGRLGQRRPLAPRLPVEVALEPGGRPRRAGSTLGSGSILLDFRAGSPEYRATVPSSLEL